MSSRLGLQMPIKTTDLHNPEANSERESISHLPHRPGPGIYGNTLPSLQDTRYNNSTNYDHTPSPASTTSLYSHYSYQPSGYQPSASPYSPTVPSLVSPYGMTPDSSRPRIPSMHSPVSHHPENPTSSSVSSARSAYATATPHTARHHHRSPRMVHPPHAPQSPQPRNMSSPPATTESPSLLDTPPPQSGPPMGNTQILCNLYSADSVLVEPEIHGRVDKGFFLADRDWTCYRRNYFTVICSYSLKPSTHSLPFYLKRTATSQPENVLAFAMCISAVVDAPGGKVVELVQHTPKRDKGPQQKPSMVKLAPQPIGGLGLYTSNAQAPQTPQGNDFNSFPQQTQQQSIAAFERIQFKSATANNGKRRAAQQYYHLIIELFADVGAPNSSAPSHTSSESGWVKIAYKTSAPMVVRGRSPGHYADERRVQSPGGNNGPGNGNTNNTQSPRSGGDGQGMMGGSDIGSSSDVLGPSRLNITNMNGYHHMGTIHSAHTSPSPSSIRDPSIATPPPPAHLDGPPIDPVITGDDGTPFYQYFPGTIYSGPHSSPIYSDVYSDERRSEGPVVTHCAQFENDISSYIPSTLLKEPRVGFPRKCGPYGDSTDGSRGYFPDLPAV